MIDEVGDRIAERRQFPVEHRAHLAPRRGRRSYCRSESRHGRPARRRGRAANACRASRPARPSAATRPASVSARYCFDQRATWRSTKAVGLAIIGKADGVGIDAVERGDGGVHRVEVGGAVRRGVRPGKSASQKIRPSTRSMTKKGGADDALVLAQAVDARDREAGAPERAHHPRFAFDRVGAGEQLARRLAAQHEGAARRRVEAVGRVGLAALELADRERAGEAGDIARIHASSAATSKRSRSGMSRVPLLASVRSMTRA